MYKMVETTTDDMTIAKSISNKLLSKKLSPCVQIIENIHSTFIWNNKLNNTNEILIRIKTKEYLINKISEIVKKMHNYDTPELISYDLNINSNQYMDWFDKSTE